VTIAARLAVYQKRIEVISRQKILIQSHLAGIVVYKSSHCKSPECFKYPQQHHKSPVQTPISPSISISACPSMQRHTLNLCLALVGALVLSPLVSAYFPPYTARHCVQCSGVEHVETLQPIEKKYVQCWNKDPPCPYALLIAVFHCNVCNTRVETPQEKCGDNHSLSEICITKPPDKN
jgi:hypothetical protein